MSHFPPENHRQTPETYDHPTGDPPTDDLPTKRGASSPENEVRRESENEIESFDRPMEMAGTIEDKEPTPSRGASSRLRIVGDTDSHPSRALSYSLECGDLVRRFSTLDEDIRAGDVEIFMTQRALRQVNEHLAADTSREYGGLLYGQRVTDPDGTFVGVVVLQAVPATHSPGSAARMSFTVDTWQHFDRMEDQWKAAGIEMQRVGWYHSHPGFSLFLSHHDLDVCEAFTHPTHLALVVDPIQNEGGFFIRGTEGFRSRAPQGFWELSDMSFDSQVTWTNVFPSDDDPSATRRYQSTLCDSAAPGAEERPGDQSSGSAGGEAHRRASLSPPLTNPAPWSGTSWRGLRAAIADTPPLFHVVFWVAFFLLAGGIMGASIERWRSGSSHQAHAEQIRDALSTHRRETQRLLDLQTQSTMHRFELLWAQHQPRKSPRPIKWPPTNDRDSNQSSPSPGGSDPTKSSRRQRPSETRRNSTAKSDDLETLDAPRSWLSPGGSQREFPPIWEAWPDSAKFAPHGGGRPTASP